MAGCIGKISEGDCMMMGFRSIFSISLKKRSEKSKRKRLFRYGQKDKVKDPSRFNISGVDEDATFH